MCFELLLFFKDNDVLLCILFHDIDDILCLFVNDNDSGNDDDLQ